MNKNINETGFEELTLEPQTKLYEKAINIAEKSSGKEKYPLVLEYDLNDEEFLLSMLDASGAVVGEKTDGKGEMTASLNEAQLKFIKGLDCIYGVRIPKETTATALTKNTKSAIMTTGTSVSSETATAATMSARSSTCSSCTSPSTMENATRIFNGVESSGCICCPGAAVWYKFIPSTTDSYRIYTSGDLDTYGVLYDANGNCIDCDDDAGEDLNFKIIGALTAGQTYYIKVTAFGSKTGRFTIRATNKVSVESVTISAPQSPLEVGQTLTLTATVLPDNATNKEVRWYSNNTSVATVGLTSGVVTAIGIGNCTISAITVDGGFEASCSVTVGLTDGLNTIERCYVRLNTSGTVNSILENLTGHDVILEEGDTVYLLDSEPFSDTNGHSWYRILYDGMMVY